MPFTPETINLENLEQISLPVQGTFEDEYIVKCFSMDAMYCYLLSKRLVGKDDLEHRGRDIGIFR